jgi:hypothetical protein
MATYGHEHTVRTTAGPAAIYALWADTPNWPAWDTHFVPELGPAGTSDVPEAMAGLVALAERVRDADTASSTA